MSKKLLALCLLILLSSISVNAAKKQNFSSKFKLGKKTVKFKPNEVVLEKEDSLGDFSLNFVKEKNNKHGVLTFYFDDIGLRLGKYKLVGPDNYIEKSGDVIAVLAVGRTNPSAGIVSENDSSATGELNITKIDKEK